MSLTRMHHQLDKIVLRGAKLRENVARNTLDARLSLGVDAVTQLSMSFVDEGLELTKSGIFTMKTSVKVEELDLEIAAFEVNPGPSGAGGVSFDARSLGVSKLKRRRGPLVMRDASPSDFVNAECKAVGLKAFCQRTPKRRQIARDTRKNKKGDSGGGSGEKPSSWTTFKRLADELGFYVFEVAGSVYFGQPTWLIDRGDEVKVSWLGGDEQTDAIAVPTCRRSEDSDRGTEVTFDVPYTRARQMRPGRGVKLSGVPRFNGSYLITNVDYSLASLGPVSVTASTPIDPEPNKPEREDDDGGGGIRGKGKYAHVVNAARDAGFRGDALVTAVAIAIAESGGRADAISPLNSNGTRDYGMWQINSVHRGSGFDTTLGLNANYNAKWAYRISQQGRNFKPWSTYWSNPFSSGAGRGKYRQYMNAARNSVDRSSVAKDIGRMARGRKSAYDFVTLCLSQAGDPYELGAVAPPSVANPHGFDCSELVAWAAGRVGVYMPGYSVSIMDYIRKKNRVTSIETAIRTRGAILYKAPGASGLALGHIAVSLGNGKTIEAAGGYGVVSLSARNRSFRWTGAGLCPGMRY